MDGGRRSSCALGPAGFFLRFLCHFANDCSHTGDRVDQAGHGDIKDVRRHRQQALEPALDFAGVGIFAAGRLFLDPLNLFLDLFFVDVRIVRASLDLLPSSGLCCAPRYCF